MKVKSKKISRKHSAEIIRSLREAGNVVEVKDVGPDYIDILYFNPASD